ncbi:Nn.00g029140.m01.CDS01 [Neocucurbitaria sp. VM-36]
MTRCSAAETGSGGLSALVGPQWFEWWLGRIPAAAMQAVWSGGRGGADRGRYGDKLLAIAGRQCACPRAIDGAQQVSSSRSASLAAAAVSHSWTGHAFPAATDGGVQGPPSSNVYDRPRRQSGLLIDHNAINAGAAISTTMHPPARVRPSLSPLWSGQSVVHPSPSGMRFL